MLTRLPVHMFSEDLVARPGAGGRWRVAAEPLMAVLAGLLWLPAAMAVVGVALGGAALPADPQGWAYLAAGGLPLVLAWFALGPVRSLSAWTAFPVLAPLSIFGCVLAAEAGAVAQAAVAAAIGLPIWLVFLMSRRVRRNTVCVENTVWRVGSVTW